MKRIIESDEHRNAKNVEIEWTLSDENEMLREVMVKWMNE